MLAAFVSLSVWCGLGTYAEVFRTAFLSVQSLHSFCEL